MTKMKFKVKILLKKKKKLKLLIIRKIMKTINLKKLIKKILISSR